MFRYLLVLVFAGIMLHTPGYGQEWFEMIHNPDANFFEIQKAAEAYFGKYGTGKGSGWKQYKRWEYMQQFRIDEQGNMLRADHMLKEVQRYREQHPVNKRNSQSGNWRELGPVHLPGNGTGQPNGLGRINCIAFHPGNADILFAGAPSGGIWKTINRGQSWTKISDGLVRLGVSSIIIHPINPDIIYIGTGDRDADHAPGYGVWRSTNGGTTWHSWNSGMGNRTVNDILMDPANPNIMIAAVYNRVYRTTDGGATWNLSHNGHNFKDLAFHPTNPDRIYAAGSRVYVSSDNGASFSQISTGLPLTNVVRIALGVSPDEPNWVYALVCKNGPQGFEGLYKSTDTGLSFSRQSSSPNILGYDTNGGYGNQGWYDLCMAVDPADANILYTGGINVWKSTDGGVNWTIKTHWWGSAGHPSVHADDHDLRFSPHNSELWLGNDGGVYKSFNAGTSWSRLSQGLAIAQVYKIGQSLTERDLIINGYQDNGTAIKRNEAWMTEIGGDGMECLVDYTDPSVMYGSLYYGDIRRSTDGGVSFSTIATNGLNGLTEAGGWVTPYKLHPYDAHTMFLGYKNVWRSRNVKSQPATTIVWEKLSDFGKLYNMVDLAISPVDSAVMMVSADGGPKRLYLSQNVLSATPHWDTIALPRNLTPTDIEFHPHLRNTVWISLGNEIYRSDNLGSSWTQVSGTLPNIPINTIVADAESNVDAIYIGMDAGVFYLDNTLTDWVPFFTDLPPVEVTELEIFYGTRCGDAIMRAATFGRGLWESELRDPGTEAPQACFKASATDICEGTTILLDDISSYGPTSWTWEITPSSGFTFLNGTDGTSPSPEVRFDRSGVYSVSMIVSNALGADTMVKNAYIIVGDGAFTLPYTMNFDSVATCGTYSDCGTTVCSLGGGWTNEANGFQDAIDWRVHAGPTPSSPNTGPVRDANSVQLDGHYVYLEGSGSCSFQSAIMTSPCFDLRMVSNASFSFNVHMYGFRMGNLHVDLFHNGVWAEDIMAPLIGYQGNGWISKTIDLSSWAGSVIKLRFRGITGGGYETDMAIDNIQMTGLSLATEVVNFSGKYIEGEGNLLEWDAENITPDETFIVQRKNPETGLFEEISQQPVTREVQYRWTDSKPSIGANYYRLVVFTVDGRYDYFETIEVVAEPDQVEVDFFPNPFEGTINLRMISNDFETIPLQIRDLQGKLVHSERIIPDARTSSHALKLDHLAPGMYMAVIRGKGYPIVKGL
jgi:photosystem II stability/assembly factor-like uncharacterized protein/PKD repeat protein